MIWIGFAGRRKSCAAEEGFTSAGFMAEKSNDKRAAERLPAGIMGDIKASNPFSSHSPSQTLSPVHGAPSAAPPG